jgi:hypothetical protein
MAYESSDGFILSLILIYPVIPFVRTIIRLKAVL